MNRIAPFAKAITGAVIAGLGAAGTALTDGGISPTEWVTIASTTLIASLAVWGTPRADPAGERQDESVQPPQGDVWG